MTTHRAETIATLFVLLAFTLAAFSAYFDLSKDVSRIAVAPGEYHTDLTPQFGPSSILWGEALARGSVAHWNPYILSGIPNLANPQSRLVTVENLLNFALRGQVSARLSIPIQMAIGWLGVFLLVRALGFASVYALILGAIYLWNPTYVGFHVATGHLNIVNGITLVPWLLYFAVRPFSRALLRPVAIAVVLALMLHGGSSTIVLYACAALFPAYALLRGQRDGVARALSELAIVVTVTTGLSWLKVAPAIDFMQISDRQHGMSTSMAFMRDAPFALGDAPAVLVAVLALTAAGAVELYRRSPAWLGLAAFATGLGAAFVGFEPAFALAREHLPVLGSLRIPSRVLFLLYLEIGLLVCLGSQWAASATSRVSESAARVVPWGIALLLLATGFALAPTSPTMVDLETRRAANPILRYVRGDSSFFRLTSFHDRDRHWGYQHQTIPYGIRTFLGYTPTHSQDFIYSHYTASVGVDQHAFVPRVFENYATMTGLLSVKYVSAMQPLEEPGLTLIQEFPISYGPQPPKSRGPYLYRNERSLPRAYHGTRAVAVTGPLDATKAAVLDVLSDRRFRAEQLTLIAAPDDDPDARVAVEAVNTLLATSGAAAGPTRAISAEALLAAPGGAGLVALPVDEPRPEELRVHVPAREAGTWIVLSEKLAMFNGWTARFEGATGADELPLFRANYVNTAVHVPPGPSGTLVLSYRSPGFVPGSFALLATVGAIAGVALWPRRVAAAA